MIFIISQEDHGDKRVEINLFFKNSTWGDATGGVRFRHTWPTWVWSQTPHIVPWVQSGVILSKAKCVPFPSEDSSYVSIASFSTIDSFYVLQNKLAIKFYPKVEVLLKERFLSCIAHSVFLLTLTAVGNSREDPTRSGTTLQTRDHFLHKHISFCCYQLEWKDSVLNKLTLNLTKGLSRVLVSLSGEKRL